MTWAKIDDGILDNRKIAEAGVLGFAIHVAGISWCCRNLTDGFIPHGRVACLLDMSQMIGDYLEAAEPQPQGYEDKFIDVASDIGPPVADRIAKRLVEVGLWEGVPGGYQIHDFLDYNPSRAKVLAEREKSAERKTKSREVSRGVSQVESRRDINRSPGGSHGPVTHAPVPVPVPVPIKKETGEPPVVQDLIPAEEESGLLIKPLAKDRYRAAFVAGIERGKGGGFVWPNGFGDEGALHSVIDKHAKDRDGDALRGERLLGWIEAAAFDFASDVTTKNTSRFFNSYGPKGFLKWLNDNEKTEEARRVG